MESATKSIKDLNKIYLEAVYGQTAGQELAQREKDDDAAGAPNKDKRHVVTYADKRGNTPAYQKYKSGDKNYKAADHLKDEYEPFLNKLEESGKFSVEEIQSIVDRVDEGEGEQIDELLGALAGGALGQHFGGKLLGGTVGKIASKAIGGAVGAGAGEMLDPLKSGKDKNVGGAALGGAAGGAIAGGGLGAAKSALTDKFPKTMGKLDTAVSGAKDAVKGAASSLGTSKVDHGNIKGAGTPVGTKGAVISTNPDQVKKNIAINDKAKEKFKNDPAGYFGTKVESTSDLTKLYHEVYRVSEGKTKAAVGGAVGDVAGRIAGGVAGATGGAAVAGPLGVVPGAIAGSKLGATAGAAGGAALGAKKGRKKEAAVGAGGGSLVAGPIGAATGGAIASQYEPKGDSIADEVNYVKSLVEKEVDVKDTRRTVDAIRAYDKSKDASRDATYDSDEGKTGKAAKERKYAAKERGEIDKDDPNWKKRKYHTGMHGEEVEVSELYTGKHGQSEKEYQAGRSDAGKRISGDDEHGPASYSRRGVKQQEPTKPGEKPQHTPKLGSAEKSELAYLKSRRAQKEEALWDDVVESLISSGKFTREEVKDIAVMVKEMAGAKGKIRQSDAVSTVRRDKSVKGGWTGTKQTGLGRDYKGDKTKVKKAYDAQVKKDRKAAALDRAKGL